VPHPREDFPDDLPRRRPTSRAAVASLILGILSLFCSILTGIPAIILACIGLGATNPSQGRLAGRGLAVAGLVTGAVGMVLNGVLLYFLLLFSVQRVHETAARIQSQNNLQQMAIAVHDYAATYNNRLPPAAVYDRTGKPLYSWRVLLLPFVEQQNLYAQFHLDEPWDSPHNIQFVQRMPKVYQLPGVTGAEPGLTYYQVFTGPDTLFPNSKAGLRPFGLVGKPDLQEAPRLYNIGNIPDGTSNTILFVEAANAVPWTKPEDIPYDPNRPVRPLLGHHFGNVTLVALADGSTRSLPQTVSETTLHNAINPADGNPLGIDW
jgi:hypothetical protein